MGYRGQEKEGAAKKPAVYPGRDAGGLDKGGCAGGGSNWK